MVIHLIAQVGIPMGIDPNHSVQINGGTVQVDNSFPNHPHAVLAICQMRVVPTYEVRAERDKKIRLVTVSEAFDGTSAFNSSGRRPAISGMEILLLDFLLICSCIGHLAGG